MKKTLAETRALCRDERYDFLFEDESRVLDTPEGLLLLGSADETSQQGYADDLLITPTEDGGWRLQYRDPEGLKEPGWGREWLDGGTYAEWEGVVGSAYRL